MARNTVGRKKIQNIFFCLWCRGFGLYVGWLIFANTPSIGLLSPKTIVLVGVQFWAGHQRPTAALLLPVTQIHWAEVKLLPAGDSVGQRLPYHLGKLCNDHQERHVVLWVSASHPRPIQQLRTLLAMHSTCLQLCLQCSNVWVSRPAAS